MRIAVSGDSRSDLDILAGLVAEGALRPVIDRTFPLDDIAAAHAHVEGRHRKGAVIVAVRPDPDGHRQWMAQNASQVAGQTVPRVA